MMRILPIVMLMCLVLVACDSSAEPTPTLADLPTSTPTVIPTLTSTAVPTDTPTSTATSTLTLTPTPVDTMTPIPTATVTPLPVNTPYPTSNMVFDNWELIEDIPDIVRDGLNNHYVVFVNQNNSETITNLSTAQPTTNVETVYMSLPLNPAGRIAILELEASTGNQIYLAPKGNAIAYFVEDSLNAATGLYVLDMAVGFSGRILATPSLSQRSIFNEPSWSPDGKYLAVTVESGYELDIFQFDVQNSSWEPLIQHTAFDFWPAYSPDGRYLAFVSDRAVCESWHPTDENACNSDDRPTPTGGHVYVMNLTTLEITQLSQEETTEPPYWVNNTTLAFSGGDQFDLLNPSRSLWLGNVVSNTSREIRLVDGPSVQLNLAESWSSDASQVIFQSVNNGRAETVIMSSTGTRLDTKENLAFARFTLSAEWSPDGTRIAVGGSDGQCPYGIRVLDDEFSFVSTGTQPRSMCNPTFSSDGQRIAFSGLSTNAVDGRVDIYSASYNGFDAVNLTIDLRGQMNLIGWVGP